MLELRLTKRILKIAGEKIEISKELARWIAKNTNTVIVYNLKPETI